MPEPTRRRARAGPGAGFRQGLDRWRENGSAGLEPRQRRAGVLVVVLIGVLVGALTIGVVNGLTPPVDVSSLDVAAAPPEESVSPTQEAVVTAAQSMARLMSSDPELRDLAYSENVDPESLAATRSAFDSGVGAAVEPYGRGATMRTQPLGYRIEVDQGRLVAVELWARQTFSAGADTGAATESFTRADLMMRWSGERWLVYAFGGSSVGPRPGEEAAGAFTPLPGVTV